MSLKNVRARRQGGFTLVELLVVLAIAGIVMGAAMPAIYNAILRNQTEGAVREAASLLQRVRLEAIRSNRTGIVLLDPANRQLVAFVDVDGDRAFNPDPTATPRTADFEVARLPLPASIEFRDEGDQRGQQSVDGFTAVGGDPWAIFLPDGSVADSGAFRFADPRDNFFEARVEPAATARIEVRKWSPTDGEWQAPGDPADPAYKPWEWR